MKKKILFIEGNRDGSVGGSYFSMLYLIEGLDKNKYQPHVLFFQKNSLIRKFEKVTPYVYVYDFNPSVSYVETKLIEKIKSIYRIFSDVMSVQFRIHKVLKKIRPDVIHLNNGYSAMHEWMLACKLHNIKLVVHDRGTRPPSSLRTKIFVQFIDALICVSDSYRNNVISENLKVKRLYRVYNGLDPTNISMKLDTNKISELKRKYRIRENQPTVGIAGNIVRWKGQIVVLRAVNKIKKYYPEIKCLLIGEVIDEEGYKNELDEYILKKGLKENIIFTGFMPNINEILSLLDIQLHASIEPEPFGRVILDGMSAAKPIVATNAGGVPEIIIDGETGILVPINDHHKMAEAIQFYLSNKNMAATMAEKGRQRLLEFFTVSRMVDEIEKIYEDVLE